MKKCTIQKMINLENNLENKISRNYSYPAKDAHFLTILLLVSILFIRGTPGI